MSRTEAASLVLANANWTAVTAISGIDALMEGD